MTLEKGSVGTLWITCGTCGETYGDQFDTLELALGLSGLTVEGTIRRPHKFSHECS